MDYENIILHIGGFGQYQRRIYLLLCLPPIICAFHSMAGVFLAAQPDYRCLLPHESLENATYELSPNFKKLSYPWDNMTENWARCERYDVDLRDHPYDLDANFSLTTSVVKCNSFVYDKTTYKLTTVTEFNLVCDNAWLSITSDSLYMVGSMLGAMISGKLSDRYGRKPIFYLCLIMNLVSGLIVAASPDIISYMILRLIVASSTCGLILISYVAAIEMVSTNRRLLAGIGMDLFFTLGYLLFAGFAYFITNWRTLQLAITAPSLVFLVYWWFIPESVRWLVTKGRLKEAKKLLLKASSENGIELSGDMLDTMLSNDRECKPVLEESSIFDLLRYPNLRRRSLLLFYIRFVINCAYFGLSWYTSNLAGNNYVNYVISGLVEIPAYVFVFFTSNKWGRKIILCGTLLIAGTSLLLTTVVPVDKPWLIVLLTMIGKSAITASVSIANIVTAEQYPTVIRNIGVGVCTTCALMGGTIAPSINHLSSIRSSLPSIIFGCGSVIAGLLVLLLPETMNKKLSDSIEESERFERNGQFEHQQFSSSPSPSSPTSNLSSSFRNEVASPWRT